MPICRDYFSTFYWLGMQVHSCDFTANERDFSGSTPLHYAAASGQSDCLTWLLKNGASITLDNLGGSPLHDAAEQGHLEVMECHLIFLLLLKHLASVAVCPNSRETWLRSRSH